MEFGLQTSSLALGFVGQASEGQPLAVVLTSAAGFLTSQLHTSVTPRGQGGRLPVAVSEGPPARLSLHVWSVFTPGGAAVWLEPVHGARGPGPPRDAPPPTQALGSQPRVTLHPSDVSRSALRSASPAQQDHRVLLGRSPLSCGQSAARTALRRFPGGQGGLRELRFFQGSWTCTACCLWPENQPLYFLRLPVV